MKNWLIATALSLLISSSIYADVTTTRPVVTNVDSNIEVVIVDNYDLGGDASTTKVYNEAERSEEHTSELQSPDHPVCRLLLEKKN